jgi:hypothetical protein
VVTRWCEYGNPVYCHVISTRCAVPGECHVVTATPPPPQPDPDWPCGEKPYFVDGRLIQACPQWPGWAIDVEVIIPPADVLRNPWPRSLVAYPTKLWFAGASDVEAWSEKARACSVDYGATYSSGSFPSCSGSPVSEGTRVNHQVGAAWRRWEPADGAIFGFHPPFEVGWSIPDREWNGGTQQKFGYAVQHSFETTSWGLTGNGPAWNPVCQAEVCPCDQRVQAWDSPAYQVVVTTWWYPQYNFRYDEFQCVGREWSDCFCRAAGEPVGQPHTPCSNPPPACNVANGAWYGKIEQCSGYAWRNVTQAWQTYDLSQLGYRPVLPWYLARQAGADPDGAQCGSYGPVGGSVPVPVIEVQPVAP